MKLYFFRGLPGSGKTTIAKGMQEQNPNTVRVNKDELRSMLHNGKHSSGREAMILTIRDYIVDMALSGGHDVIVDDTNFNPLHEATLRAIAKKHGAAFEVRELSDVTPQHLQTCITNDLKRGNSVGEKVIRQMRNQYLVEKLPKPKPPKEVEGGEDAVICDIDGTLALFGDANPYVRDFSKDKVNRTIARMVRTYFTMKNRIILFSGRNSKFKEETEEWLFDHRIPYHELHMRAEDDTRRDFVVKHELYEKHVLGKYNVLFVLDDRDQVVRLWRSLGLTCLQVAPGDF